MLLKSRDGNVELTIHKDFATHLLGGRAIQKMLNTLAHYTFHFPLPVVVRYRRRKPTDDNGFDDSIVMCLATMFCKETSTMYYGASMRSQGFKKVKNKLIAFNRLQKSYDNHHNGDQIVVKTPMMEFGPLYGFVHGLDAKAAKGMILDWLNQRIELVDERALLACFDDDGAEDECECETEEEYLCPDCTCHNKN